MSVEVDEYSKTHCDCCQEDIPGFGIDCIECPVQLCLECFGLGAEVGRHKAHHRYRFFDCSGDLFLCPKDTIWTYNENLKLLDAIELYGYGDWKSITDYILSENHEYKKIKLHFDSKTGKQTWPRCMSHQPKNLYQSLSVDDGPLSPSATTNLSPLLITTEETSKLGCMPLTDDYEKEHDNDAEELISELKYNSDDDEIDLAIKLTLVDMYTTRLRERVRRKEIIRDYQLVEEFFKKKSTRKRNKCSPFERNLRETFRPFSQFHSASEHFHIIKNMLKERELIHRIQELSKYRQNGITKHEDCAEFDKIVSKTNEKLNLNGICCSSDSEQKRQKRKRKRLLLSRQKSHTPAVLLRRQAHRAHSKFHRRKKCSKLTADVSQDESQEDSVEKLSES